MSEYHEPTEELSEEARDAHRALTSLQEEIEAVDWYNQRVDCTKDEELKAILEHNRDEEIEHACMVLEWLRRRTPAWDENLRTYLFTRAPITGIEEGGTGREDHSDLGIGSLKE
jgi:ferritin-like protein